MIFEPQTLAPGPGIGVQAMATFRWRSFQSTLSGSGVFQASTSGRDHDLKLLALHRFQQDRKGREKDHSWNSDCLAM